MIVNNIALLAANTARTKAYIQLMLKNNLVPEICVVYTEHKKQIEQECFNFTDNEYEADYFDKNIPLLWTLKKNNITYIIIENNDINSEEVTNCLKKLPQEYIIYSGYGGAILRKPLFDIGKKYIHIHAGILPEYRGSTTVYYSYLQERKFGATAIFLSEGIDEGEIIFQETFDIPKEKVNIDYVYEPYLRATVLVKVMQRLLKTNALTGIKQENDNAETYFIIHPVLKHLALLGIETEIRSNSNENSTFFTKG